MSSFRRKSETQISKVVEALTALAEKDSLHFEKQLNRKMRSRPHHFFTFLYDLQLFHFN